MCAQPTTPISSVVPVTRVEGYGYTLLVARPEIAHSPVRVDWCGSTEDFDSFEGDTAVFVNVDGYSGNKIGGSRAAHWMLLHSALPSYPWRMMTSR